MAYGGLRVVPEPAGSNCPTRAPRSLGPTAGSDIFGWREGGFGWGREGRTDLGFRGGKGKSSPLGAGVVGGRRGRGPGGKNGRHGCAYRAEGGS